MRSAFIAGSILVAATMPTLAADVDPDAAIARAWDGCYVGVNAGYALGRATAIDLPYVEGPFAGLGTSWNSAGAPYETIRSRSHGLTGGAEAGCDATVPLGSAPLVVGAVVDFSLLDANGVSQSALSADTFASFDVDWTATVRGRVGVAIDDVLLFATGGYAAAHLDVRAFDLSNVPSAGTMDVSRRGVVNGWVVGGGAEWRMRDNLSVSLEYFHYGLAPLVATGPATFPIGANPRFSNRLSLDTVRVGLKWRL